MQLFRSAVIVYLSVWIVLAGVLTGLAPLDASAALMPSDVATATVIPADQRAADLDQIQSQLESKLVSQRLSDLGLTSEEVQLRLQSLTSEQIHQVAQNLDGVQMGGDLILILAIVGAVVLILALIGWIGHAH